jgi:hypothetical protein
MPVILQFLSIVVSGVLGVRGSALSVHQVGHHPDALAGDAERDGAALEGWSGRERRFGDIQRPGADDRIGLRRECRQDQASCQRDDERAPIDSSVASSWLHTDLPRSHGQTRAPARVGDAFRLARPPGVEMLALLMTQAQSPISGHPDQHHEAEAVEEEDHRGDRVLNADDLVVAGERRDIERLIGSRIRYYGLYTRSGAPFSDTPRARHCIQ